MKKDQTLVEQLDVRTASGQPQLTIVLRGFLHVMKFAVLFGAGSLPAPLISWCTPGFETLCNPTRALFHTNLFRIQEHPTSKDVPLSRIGRVRVHRFQSVSEVGTKRRTDTGEGHECYRSEVG